MDPLTHSLLGGTLVRALQPDSQRKARIWGIAGLLGAMAPDLDVLIQSSQNPTLLLKFHRHFTHSLAFIPLGGLFVGFVLWLLARRTVSLRDLWLASTIGYATHSLLDACTSYGTLLLWPFSLQRISWDVISIVDPIVTVPLLFGFLLSSLLKSRRPALVFLLMVAVYFSFGIFQHERARAFQQRIAHERGTSLERGRVMPSLANLFVWRSIYESGGKLYVDAIRVAPFRKAQVWEGGSTAKWDIREISLSPGSSLREKLELYQWFSEDYLAKKSIGSSIQLYDLRYSPLPQGLEPLWGIQFDLDHPDRSLARLRFSARGRTSLSSLWEMVKGEREGAKTF